MGFMSFWWIGGLVVMILLVWVVVRAGAGGSVRGEDSPETILKRRYARGEIEREEFDRRLTDLRK